MTFKNVILLPAILALSLLSTGCCSFCLPPEAKSTASENSKLCDAFILFMDAGQTTREQEQKFIRANRRAWHAQNYALNDEPLPKDVEIWESRRKLGLANDPSSSTPAGSLTVPEDPTRRVIPR